MQMMKRISILCAIVASINLCAQIERTVDSSLEILESDTVSIGTAWVRIEVPIADSVSLSVRTEGLQNEIDYRANEPIDPFGSDQQIEEGLIGAQVRMKYVRNLTEWAAVASVYDGFRNYSSIWIDEYYRQQYGNGGIPGVRYESPSPKGGGLDLSWRREVVPGTGYLSMSFGFLSDRVAPGYDIEDLNSSFELVRGETDLDTVTGSLSWEGILNKYMRTRQSIRLTDTTGRDLRWSWTGDLNWLMSERWILRSSSTYANEKPNFEAWSVSETLEFEIRDRWFLSGTVRYYSDSGQIESANLISSAAPALISRQALLSLRYETGTGRTAFSISTGPYRTRYGKTGIGTERFKYLYSDRDWWLCRFAVRHIF